VAKSDEGDVDAKTLFQILIRENTDMLMAYLRTGVRDRHAVDDLYQETVLTAWRRLDSYDRDKPIGPWLRGIAGRLMLAYYRKTSKAAQPLDEATLDWLNERFSAIHSMPGDTLHEKLVALRECINSLPETYQRPISMRFSEGLGLSEIESALNIAKATLKKRLTRAKARLADCLERKLGLAGANS
jgi:RNA polymerase sigma-70 factor (ECF subfamily)